MTRRGTLVWAAVALLGIALAGGISLGVRALTNDQVGLASEPITAGEDLAPQADRAARAARARRQVRRERQRRAAARAVPQAPPTVAPPPITVEDSVHDDGSGRGRGRGRGRSDGDSGSGSGSDDSGGGSDDD